MRLLSLCAATYLGSKMIGFSVGIWLSFSIHMPSVLYTVPTRSHFKKKWSSQKGCVVAMVESIHATCLFVAMAQCKILHCRAAVCFSIGGLYRELQRPRGEQPGTSKSNLLDINQRVTVGDFHTPCLSAVGVLKERSAEVVHVGSVELCSSPCTVWRLNALTLDPSFPSGLADIGQALEPSAVHSRRTPLISGSR